jgi:hypothetical protein
VEWGHREPNPHLLLLQQKQQQQQEHQHQQQQQQQQQQQEEEQVAGWGGIELVLGWKQIRPIESVCGCDRQK